MRRASTYSSRYDKGTHKSETKPVKSQYWHASAVQQQHNQKKDQRSTLYRAEAGSRHSSLAANVCRFRGCQVSELWMREIWFESLHSGGLVTRTKDTWAGLGRPLLLHMYASIYAEDQYLSGAGKGPRVRYGVVWITYKSRPTAHHADKLNHEFNEFLWNSRRFYARETCLYEILPLCSVTPKTFNVWPLYLAYSNFN